MRERPCWECLLLTLGNTLLLPCRAGAVTLASLFPVFAVQIMSITVGLMYDRAELLVLVESFTASDNPADRCVLYQVLTCRLPVSL